MIQQPFVQARRIAFNIQVWISAILRQPRPRSADLRRHPRWLICGSVVLVAAALTLMMFVVDAWAIAEMRRLPTPLVAIFDEITDFGKSGWLLFPLAFALLGSAALPATLPRSTRVVIAALTARLGFLFVAIAVPGIFTLFSKYLIGRARPYAAGGDPHVFHLLLRSEYASMPSGHSTTAFAAAAIGAVWPKAKAPAWAYALTIGASRIIVTAHFPSDVIASAIVGVTGATLVRNYFATRSYVFYIGQDGHVYPFAGPSSHRFKRAIANLMYQQ